MWYRWVISRSFRLEAGTSPSREARWQISVPMMGLRPVIFWYRALWRGAGEERRAAPKASSVTSRGFSFSTVMGIK